MKIQLTGSSATITLTSSSAVALEIKFNLTDKGRCWVELGDALYANTDVTVSYEQFTYLKTLATANGISFIASGL